ncbi:glycosyltransferase family 31 protein [Purpureocillium lavendulum]|uniref:Glycosyltransferase family 31 protein n=1 Tax=Purpureocillium lavendulum TaxID=1247861 RepID=A0AB34FRD8_9HYPO|nr:glycosyltransferase family 31 protein [Purpureocillium lavendulum]
MDLDADQWPAYGESLADLDLRTPGLEPRSGDTLPLLQADEWDEHAAYDETPPQCIHYDLIWKISLNKGSSRLTSLTEFCTENNLVLAPGAYWETILNDRVQQVLRRKTPADKVYTIEETKIKVSIDRRGKALFSKTYDFMDIEWCDVEREMEKASGVLLQDKHICVEVTVVYKDTTPAGAKRGRGAGNRQRAEHDALVNGGGDQTPHPGAVPLWKQVYRLFRCASSSCGGDYCWDDPVDQKHYTLDTTMMDRLVEHAQTSTLETFDHVPQDIRNIIRAREQGSAKRRKVSPEQPPIHIHMPQTPGADALQPTTLKIPGPRDEAMHRYREWSCTQVHNTRWREQLRQAFKILEEGCIDLHDAHESREEVIDYLVSKDVQWSIAKQVVRHVSTWFQAGQAQDQAETGDGDSAL